jgi:hypothetical protein
MFVRLERVAIDVRAGLLVTRSMPPMVLSLVMPARLGRTVFSATCRSPPKVVTAPNPATDVRVVRLPNQSEPPTFVSNGA